MLVEHEGSVMQRMNMTGSLPPYFKEFTKQAVIGQNSQSGRMPVCGFLQFIGCIQNTIVSLPIGKRGACA